MEADASSMHLGPVPPGSEARTPNPGELVEPLRVEVSTQRERIETAKMNRMQPYPYLKATIVAIAHCNPTSKFDQLLFWAFVSVSR